MARIYVSQVYTFSQKIKLWEFRENLRLENFMLVLDYTFAQGYAIKIKIKYLTWRGMAKIGFPVYAL